MATKLHDDEVMGIPQVGPISFESNKQPSSWRLLRTWLIFLAIIAACVGIVGIPFWAAFELRLMRILWMITGAATVIWAFALVGGWVVRSRVHLADLRDDKAVVLNAAFVVLGSMEFARAVSRCLFAGTDSGQVFLWGAVAIFFWGLLAISRTTFRERVGDGL